MSVPRFTFTDRAAPFVEIGIGDARTDTGVARWDAAHWDDAGDATWAGTEPLWQSIDCNVFETTIELGRQRATDRFAPATCSVVAANVDGWADMDTTVPPSLLELRPGRALRVGVDHAVFGRIVLWRGYVDSVVPRYDPGDIDSVFVDGFCALGEAGRVKLGRLAAGVGAGELGNVRVGRFLDAAKWPAGLRDIRLTGVPMLATTLGRPVADLLAVTAESVGGAVFGDTAGRVAFRGRDWQAFDPDTPIDGTIGDDADAGHACPAGWDVSSRRSDMVTQCVLARAGDTAPVVYDDETGQALYGVEAFEATDLTCQDAAQLDLLAARLFRVRGHTATPRIERVRLDAAFSDANLDVMSRVDIFKPSRYRCVLNMLRGEVFDVEMLATGVRHFITGAEWQCEIDLDVAAPYATDAGRWDTARWDDAMWAAPTALAKGA